MRALLLFASFALWGLPALAQETMLPQPKLQLNHEISGHIGVHANGWQVGGRIGLAQTFGHYTFLDLEFAKLKHPKEYRQVNPSFSNAHSFIFGKLNQFGTLRMGLGCHTLLTDKEGLLGVEVSYLYSAGLSLGLIKPVYLEIIQENAIPTIEGEYPVTIERYEPGKHQLYDIRGGAEFSQGFNQLRIHPGIYAKGGLQFEFSEYDEDIKAIEVGAIADYFFSPPPIMAFTKNPSLFAGFYLNVSLGKRW